MNKGQINNLDSGSGERIEFREGRIQGLGSPPLQPPPPKPSATQPTERSQE